MIYAPEASQLLEFSHGRRHKGLVQGSCAEVAPAKMLANFFREKHAVAAQEICGYTANGYEVRCMYYDLQKPFKSAKQQTLSKFCRFEKQFLAH